MMLCHWGYVCAGLCQMSGVRPGQGDGGVGGTGPLHRVLRRGQSGGPHSQQQHHIK